MSIYQKLVEIAQALDDILTKTPQVEAALTSLNTFLDSTI